LDSEVIVEYAGNISGNKPHIRKYQVDGGVTIDAGEPVLTGDAVADNGGVTIATTIAAVSQLGVALDTATSTDAQPTSGNNVASVSTVINPDAMWRTKFSGGATEDTALTICSAAQAASTDGLTVTGCTDLFTVWCYKGTNVGAGWRRATDAATVVVAFPNDIAALDEFLEVPIYIGSVSQYPQLTTNLTQIDASAAVDNDNANYFAVDFELRDDGDDGKNNSYALLVGVDHAFGPNRV
jgi:hypothetical protein